MAESQQEQQDQQAEEGHHCEDFGARHFALNLQQLAEDIKHRLMAADKNDKNEARADKNEARGDSVFDENGEFKSQEEVTRIAIAVQWRAIARWVDESIGHTKLVWVDGEIYPENIQRLAQGHVILKSTVGKHAVYTFQFVRAAAQSEQANGDGDANQ